MKRILAAVCLVSVMGCNAFRDRPTSTYEVYVDPAFGDQTELVLDALQDWEAKVHASGSPLTLHATIVNMTCDSGCYDAIAIHPVPQSFITSQHGAESDAVGVTFRFWDDTLHGNTEYSNVYIANDLDDTTWFRVVRHELGHSLALLHTGSGTIMAPNVNNASPDISDADVQQFNDLRQ